MNKKEYQDAVNMIKFRQSFEQDTIALLTHAAEQKTEKEINQMKTQKPIRTILIAAALVAALALSAFALSVLLSPKEIAEKSGDTTLAKAFDSKDAVIINQSQTAGEFTVTLNGIVSGKGLTDYCEEADENKSYIVASVAYTDGRQIAQAGETEMTFSPMVSGYKPWQVNAWTLRGGYSSFLYDGVNYYIFECDNLELFADHTVYLAAYQGNAPDSDTFQMSEAGDISFVTSFDKPHAMFTLPLDSSKADPAAAKQLLDSAGVVIE